MKTAQLQSLSTLSRFIFAGAAIFTLVSRRTGERRTFKVERAKKGGDTRPWFVSVLYGPNNVESLFAHILPFTRKPTGLVYPGR